MVNSNSKGDDNMDWDFIANGSVDTIDLVPDAFKGYYEEDKAAGAFVLKADIKPLAEAYTGANKKLTTFGKQKKDDNTKDAARRLVIDGIAAKLAEAGIEVGDDVAKLPDIISEKFTELLGQVKGGKEAKVNLEAIKADFNKRLAAELAKKDGDLTTMRGSLEKYMVNSAAATALAEAGTVEKGAELLMPIISRSVKVVQEDGEYNVKVVDSDNNVRLNNRGEPMGIKDLIGELKLSHPIVFKSEAKQGGGKQPGTGKVPASGSMRQQNAGERTPNQKISAGLATLGR
jgi:hypothetical protein